jgi:hypothetical protein
MVKKKINYEQGTCFFVPLRDGTFARGLVARYDGDGRLFAYFFGPKLQEPTNGFENLLPQNAVLSGLCGDLGLVDEEWPMAGTLKGWERSDWPLPPFYREDEDANRAWLTYYDEDTLDFIREEPIEPQQHSAYPYDRVMGYGSVEIRLTKLLSM